MRGKIWRKALAASLALLIVSGSVPIKPISNVFESMVVTAEAVEEVTKTYSLSTYVRADDYLSFSLTDPDDNTSKTVFAADGDTNTHLIRKFGSGVQLLNTQSFDDSPNVRYFVLPNVNGKVTKIEFTKACRVAGKVAVGDHDAWPPTWEDTSFFMSIDGMKYNGTDEALTGESHLDERGNTTESENFTFISTDPEGIEGKLSLWLGKMSMFTMLSGCEIKIHYIPAAEPAHEHDFTYSMNGNTLTATCGHSDGRSCSLADSNHQISVSLEADDAYYQFGYIYPATLSNNSLFASETGATIGNITYRNNTTGQDLGTQKPTGSGENPTGAGDYTASVTINVGGTTYTLTKDYTLSNLFTINNSYPQFSIGTEKYSVTNRAAENETVTLTFTPQYGETLKSLSVKGATTNYSLGKGITKVDDTHYTFSMPAEEVNISEVTFGIDENDFVQDGDTYTIKNADGWNYFCLLTNYDTTLDGFNGKTVKLDKDIEVSAMEGMSGHPFKGTFDGQNHTLTFNRTAAEDFCAPFHYINGATISNLHVDGTITGGTYGSLGGLVGRAEGNITIENCHVSTQISTTYSAYSGSAWHGGVIAEWNGTNATCTVTGCVYDGLIYNPNEAGVTGSCRGFIGWDYGNYGTITFTDCLSAPAAYGTGKYALGDNCCTFVYPNSEPTMTYNMTNCYYTTALGNRQGRPAATATTAPANLGNATTDHGLVKGYENGFLYNDNYYTPKYGDAVVEYSFDDRNERASVTFNGDGNNLVGVNITEEVGNIKSVTYNRPFNTGVATTVILPFNYECNGDEGGTFYNFKDVTYDQDKHVWVCKIIAPGEDGSNNVTSLTANTPYLFMPTDEIMTFPNITNMTGGVVTLQPTTLNEYGGATTNDNWNFYGTYTGKNWTGSSKDYGFAAHSGPAVNGEEVVEAGQFVRFTTGASIGPMRCYLRYAGNGELVDPNPVANPGEGVPTREVPWWDGNDGYESTEIFNTVAHNINITAPTNGSVTATVGETANPATAFKGDTVNLTVTPDEGYTIKSVKYNDTNATKNADGTYSFEMPAEDVTVTAVFGHTVAIDNNITNGTVSADLPVAENNEAVTLTVTPATGYAVKSVKVGNTEIEPVNGVYSFTMPADNVTVTAEFEATDYNISITAPANGSVSATVGETANATTAHYGDTVILTATPTGEYVLKSLTVKDSSNNPITVTNNQFTMPASDVTVDAEFRKVYSDGIGERLMGYSLSLEGDIGVNFYMELDDSVVAHGDTAYIRFTTPKGSDTETKTVLVKDAVQKQLDGKTYYVFKCNVSAKDMASEITAQMFDGDKPGTEYKYSVKDYAEYILEHNEVKEYADAALLVKAMLNYGAASQTYFGIEGTAANAGLGEADKVLNYETIPEKFKYNEANANLPEGVTFEGATLSLKSETTLSLYFKGLPADTKFICDGKTVETAKNGKYVVARIRGIKASELENDFTVSFKGESMTYNAMAYCYKVLNGGTNDENLQNVCKALYLYAQAAKTYSE